MGVFWNHLRKMQVISSKEMLGLGVGWTHFYKITLTNSKMVFGYGVLFVVLKSMQLLINKS
jgi:hypothetical protein